MIDRPTQKWRFDDPSGAFYSMRTERPMTLDVLTGMGPDRVRGSLATFSVKYVQDWEKWLLVPPPPDGPGSSPPP